MTHQKNKYTGLPHQHDKANTPITHRKEQNKSQRKCVRYVSDVTVIQWLNSNSNSNNAKRQSKCTFLLKRFRTTPVKQAGDNSTVTLCQPMSMCGGMSSWCPFVDSNLIGMRTWHCQQRDSAKQNHLLWVRGLLNRLGPVPLHPAQPSFPVTLCLLDISAIRKNFSCLFCFCFFLQIMCYFRQPPTLTLGQPFQCLKSGRCILFCVVTIASAVPAGPTDWLTRPALGISPLSTRNL